MHVHRMKLILSAFVALALLFNLSNKLIELNFRKCNVWQMIQTCHSQNIVYHFLELVDLIV